MVKGRAQPSIDGMALLALGWELRSDVIRRVGLLVGGLVTRVALDGEPLELSNRFAFVAVGAIQPGVSSHQRKAVLMFAYTLQNDVPALDRVALFAVGTHLAAVDVGVAVGAVGPGIGEHWFGMTLGAGYTLV